MNPAPPPPASAGPPPRLVSSRSSAAAPTRLAPRSPCSPRCAAAGTFGARSLPALCCRHPPLSVAAGALRVPCVLRLVSALVSFASFRPSRYF
eukprot:5669321-Prymnesium_polylepis.1